jgi:hypothetical protein
MKRIEECRIYMKAQRIANERGHVGSIKCPCVTDKCCEEICNYNKVGSNEETRRIILRSGLTTVKPSTRMEIFYRKLESYFEKNGALSK